MSRLEPFWDVTCDYRDYLWLGIMVLIFLFVLTGMSIVLAPQNTGSFIVAMMNFALLLVTGGVMGGMFYKCLQRERDGY